MKTSKCVSVVMPIDIYNALNEDRYQVPMSTYIVDLLRAYVEIMNEPIEQPENAAEAI